MNQVGDDLMTTAELAKVLRRSPESVQRWRRMRVGPPYIRVQGRVFYSQRLLEEWLQKNTCRTVAA